ncbi:hypothetical protein FB45DRAFT_880153 [Roridomyces roridus]|uniref:Uncharacterized protein n=1 Tax=Roridomyces roridus TaxID=1738132 RepID=A0AAD7AYT8_9AGAR|nr:hypothetical protein FB45DRAFT_880153 [Roridomyces roridus]
MAAAPRNTDTIGHPAPRNTDTNSHPAPRNTDTNSHPAPRNTDTNDHPLRGRCQGDTLSSKVQTDTARLDDIAIHIYMERMEAVVEDDGTLVEWEDVSKLVAYSRCVEYEVILRTSSLGAGETTRESPSRAWSVISSVRDNDERVAMTDVICLMSERGRVYGSEELALTEEYTTRKTSRELGAQSRAWLSVARLFVSERVRSVGKCRHWEPQGEARITSQKIAARVLEWRAVVSLGNACNWEPPSSVREVGGMRVIEVAGNGCTE